MLNVKKLEVIPYQLRRPVEFLKMTKVIFIEPRTISDTSQFQYSFGKQEFKMYPRN
jgi:hypothetical protein